MKKFAALLLCLCLMIPVFPAKASDEPPAWAAEAYQALKERHVIIGLVGPSPVNRGEFVDMLIRLLDNTFPQEQLARFSPVWDWSGSTFAPTSVARAMGYGIVEGTVDSDGNRLFNGNDPLTREQAAKMVCSLLDFFSQKLGYTLEPSGVPAVYADAASISAWAKGYYTIDNGDGTVSGLVVGADAITVERFHADGSLASSKTMEKELLIFGAFLDAGDRFYLAFRQDNGDQDDNREVWRIVQYDREWNRLGAASVNGGDSYTTLSFSATVSRMAVSADGKTLALHAARDRYTTKDGLRHQSNITITVDTANMSVLSVSEEFPFNHVSHSFGQFVRYDGEEMVTVDHGDAYPRAFVLHDDAQEAELLKIAGSIGNNVTNAIGSGLEISEDGYLFLGCSNPQNGTGGPWNVFLTYTAKDPKEPALTWLTHSDTTIGCARLVKLDENTFVAMWQYGTDVHYQKLDGKGQLVGQEQVYPHALMPPTDPVVMDGDICWIQATPIPSQENQAVLYRIDMEG